MINRDKGKRILWSCPLHLTLRGFKTGKQEHASLDCVQHVGCIPRAQAVKSDLLDYQEPIQLSKRKVLSKIAHIYDPIGFASAFMISAKIALQALWKRGINWDEELLLKLSQRWKRLLQEMVQLNGVRFDSCLTSPNAIGQPILCVFSDASKDAFGACAYARLQLATCMVREHFVLLLRNFGITYLRILNLQTQLMILDL